jgi:hypothetical protein
MTDSESGSWVRNRIAGTSAWANHFFAWSSGLVGSVGLLRLG